MVENLDFVKNKVQAVDLETLQSSISEKYPNGEPIGDMYHYQAILEVCEIMNNAGFQPVIKDMFAANNRDRFRPGVTIDDEKAREFGMGSPKCHILRRVFCNISLQDLMPERGITLNAAISYSQRGITVAFGSHVAYCRNLHLLGAEHFFSNYATGYAKEACNNMSNAKEMMDAVQKYAGELIHKVDAEMNFLTAMQAKEHDAKKIPILFEKLMRARIQHDTEYKGIRKYSAYPLNSAQINNALERYYISAYESEKIAHILSWWDVFNILNIDLNAQKTEIPSVLPQAAALSDLFTEVVMAE